MHGNICIQGSADRVPVSSSLSPHNPMCIRKGRGIFSHYSLPTYPLSLLLFPLLTTHFLLVFSVVSVPPCQGPSFHQLAASCSLLPLFFALVPFVFSNLQPLFRKTGGWGWVWQPRYGKIPAQ